MAGRPGADGGLNCRNTHRKGKGRRAQAQLFRLLAGLDAPLMQLTVVKDTLEEVFLRATTEE